MTPIQFAAYLRGFRAALGDKAPTDEQWADLVKAAESVSEPMPSVPWVQPYQPAQQYPTDTIITSPTVTWGFIS